MIDNQRAALRYQNKVNNAQGHFFESAIKAACALYSDRERADVDKTPEPFRVLEKSRDGKFKGRFTARFNGAVLFLDYVHHERSGTP